jgi:hypothetical protein
MRLLVAYLASALLAACASPPAPAPERAAAYGYVRLVPREGVTATGGSHSYGDREFEGVSFVDYSKPGFAVVYLEAPDGRQPAGDTAQLAIRAGTAGAVFEPPHAALGAGGTLAIRNESGEPHLVSCPNAKLVKKLAPGESVAVATTAPGEWPVFLLDVAGEQARVFAAPGPYRVVASSGRYELGDLPPGPARLHAWHPRFPAASADVLLAAGQSARVDLDLRIGAGSEENVDAE